MKTILGFDAIRLISLIVLTLALAFLASYCLRYHTMEMPYFLRIHYKSSVDSSAQVFFDTGRGFNQSDSCSKRVFSSNEFRQLSFALSPKKIRRLRLDPLSTSGEFHIQEAAIVRSGKSNGDYETLHKIDFKSFEATNDLMLTLSPDGLLLKCAEGAVDPISEISLAQPLDDWEVQDFMDKEFLQKAFLLFFVVIPVVLVTAHPFTRLSTKKVSFLQGDERVDLERGRIYRREPDECYRDAPQDTLEHIVSRIDLGENWKTVLSGIFEEKYNWLYQVITSESRSMFLSQIKPKASDLILDIGAGWGQFSIPLAKTNQVCSLEPTPERLKFIRSVSRQEGIEGNMFFVGADYLEIKFKTKFDLVLCIGVLEWVGCFQGEIDPVAQQRAFLKKTKNDLNDGGRLVIGIENRLGLKYLMGAPDDHTGLSLVSCMRSDIAKKKHKEQTGEELKCFTYSMEEYEEMLLEAGFTNILFFAAFPDYKLPEKIFPVHGKQCSLNEYLSDGNRIIEHNGRDGSPLAEQDKLNSIYSTLASKKVAHNFAPSFYIEAS